MSKMHAHKRDWIDVALEAINDPQSTLNKRVDYLLWFCAAIVVAMIIIELTKGN